MTLRMEKRFLVVVAMLFVVAAIAGCTSTKTKRKEAYEEGKKAADRGDPNAAIRSFTAAIHFDPKYVPAYYARGLVYTKNGDYDKAIAGYTEAIRLKPGYAAAYYGRGMALKRKGDKSKAEADLAEAKKLGFSTNPKAK